MLGAIIGDIIGSTFEFSDTKPDYAFELFPEGSSFTDDTLLTLATAKTILGGSSNYENHYASMARKYIHEEIDTEQKHKVGFGEMFAQWARNYNYDPTPYNSWGNGAAMRVSPIAWANNDHRTVLIESIKSAKCTHNHAEGIKGAVATAMSIYIARMGGTKKDIKSYIEDVIGYDLFFQTQVLREKYRFDVSAKGSVPVAIYCFLESDSFEETMRLVQYVGGDSDTTGAIAGGIAEAFFGIDSEVETKALTILEDHEPELYKLYIQFREEVGFKKQQSFKRWW